MKEIETTERLRSGVNAKSAGPLLAAAVASVAVFTQAVTLDLLDRPHPSSILSAIHPQLAIKEAMVGINDAASQGKAPSAQSLDQLVDQSASVPLSPDPFLVSAIDAESRGETQRAEKLLLAARARDPRSVAVRYFLADHFRKSGDLRQSLVEVAAMLRLRSDTGPGFASYFAQIAQDRGGRDAVSALMQADPTMGRQVLAEMANAGVSPAIVFGLASRLPQDASDRIWQTNLVSAAVARGHLDQAYTIWLQLVGNGAGEEVLHNARFAEDPLPAPFSWTYQSSPAGVAERDGRGGLSVLSYGRTSAVLASQLLRVALKDYRLTWKASDLDDKGGNLKWRVACFGQTAPLAEARMSAGNLQFRPPDGCSFLRLELVAEGSSLDSSSAVVSELALVADR